MSTEILNAADNPDLANSLVAKATSEQVVKSSGLTEVTSPPDTLVELPGGIYEPFMDVIRTAEIRELNGADEEAIARISDPGKALLMILERATVKIGDKPASKEVLDEMLAGDREMLLLAIRKVTFGTEVTYEFPCPQCGVSQDFVVDLNEDIEIKKLDESELEFSVECNVGTVVLNLPTGVTQKALVSSSNKTTAELDTLLLKGCIASINDAPILGAQQIKNLSIKDRRTLLEAISTRNPGPQLSAISKLCSSCGQEVPLPLTLVDLFRE